MAQKTDSNAAGGDKKAKGAKPAGKGRESVGSGADIRPAEGRPKSGGGKARLREHYHSKVVAALRKDFNYKNPMAVPKIEKISINTLEGADKVLIHDLTGPTSNKSMSISPAPTASPTS